MSGRLRFEAWTLPTAATFQKITDVPALAGSTGTRELSSYTDGSLHVPADWDGLSLIVSTTVGSLIRVFDGATLVDEFLAERVDQPVDRPNTITISGTQVNGLVEKLAVYPYNYPNDISTAQDWVWGGPTIIPSLVLADLGNVREVWELWHDATGGSFTLTVDGQITTAIDFSIVSPTVIENRLQTLTTVNDVTVAGGNSSVREVIELYNTATGGSQGLTVTVDGVDETATWAYNAAAATVDTALQALTIVTSTTVTGAGTVGSPWVITFNNPNNPSSVAKDDTLLTGGTSTLTSITAGESDPWVITFYDPPNPTTFTIANSLTGGNPDGPTLTLITAGALDPSPITQSQFADTRIDPLVHGTYTDPAIQVVETLLNTGSDWALLVNATGQFAGSQIILSVKPGHTYSNCSLPVRPDSNGKYRLVIRDIYENQIAATNPYEVALTAGTYQTLTVPQFTVPDGVNQIIMRVAVVQPTYADFRVDWQHATLNEGDAEATPGEIVRILVENGQVERTAFTFLDISGFTDTTDTDGTTWASAISFTASFGQHLGHVLDGLAGLGYEWRITPKATPSGGFTHDLDLLVPGGAGTDLTATTGGPAVMTGTVRAANVVKRVPAYTAAVAWGNGTYLEDTDATRLTNFGRWERVFDAEHLSSTASLQELLAAQFAEQATNLTATQATVDGDDPTVPLVHYLEGDTVWWQFPGVLAKEARRVKRISWTHGDLASYTLHASTVHTADSAMAAAVNRLLNKYERRRGGRSLDPIPVAITPAVGPHTLIVAASDTLDPAGAHIVCTGVADDVTIKAGMTSRFSAEGGSVYLMEGGYNFSDVLDFEDWEFVFQGAGDSTIIRSASTSSAFIQQHAAGGRGVYQDFRLVDVSTSGTPTGIFSNLAGSTHDTTINRVTFEGFNKGVLHFRTTGTTRISDCDFFDCTYGIEGDRDGTMFVDGCTFGGTFTYGVNADADVASITNNYFVGGTYGVFCFGSTFSQLAIAGNQFRSTTTTSIHLEPTDATSNVTIVANTFESSAKGIRLTSNPTAIVANTFSNCTVAYAAAAAKHASSKYIGNVFSGTTPDIAETVPGMVSAATVDTGTATIIDTAATQSVTHGMTGTPTSVTVSSDGNELVWVTAIGATTFTLTRAGTSGARVCYWSATI
jgi:hypothetical protein